MPDSVATFVGDVRASGRVTAADGFAPLQARADILTQTALAVHPIPLRLFTGLPYVEGLFGTDAPKISGGDVRKVTITRRCRVVFPLPALYEAGQTVTLRLSAGMGTTVADGSATIDAEVYVSGRDGTKDGSDLCQTDAQTINSLTFVDRDFVIDASSLTPGDELDIRISFSTVDSSTNAVVDPCLGAAELLVDIR